MPKSQKAINRKMRRSNRRAKMSDDQGQHGSVVHAEEAFAKPGRKPSVEPILPLNDAQGRYMTAINSSRVIFGTGPAGTGKTWLAAAIAADKLRNREIDKIILTRPAVEAGEKLGFLPGDLKEKYAPYLDPFLQALEDRLGSGHVEYLLRKGIIEPRPLAFMRGLTFKDAFVLADEAQNISKTQMKMLLSRIGNGSTMVISGDIRQSDLPQGQSGLPDAIDRLGNVEGIKSVTFTVKDIVRDDICQKIVEAYER